MPAWLAPLAVSVGGAVVGSLFGKRKQFNVPSYSEFYAQYRKEHPEEFGLSQAEFRQAYGAGTEMIRGERDVAIARSMRGLPQNSVARGLVPIQAASESQRSFAELVGRIQSLHARTAKEEKSRYDQLALGAYGSELQRVQLQMAQEGQSEDFFSSVMQSISDPIQSYMLMRELENLDKAQAAKTPWGPETEPVEGEPVDPWSDWG